MCNKLRLKDDDNGVLEFNSSLFAKIKNDKVVVSKLVIDTEHSTTAIIYNDQYFFKFYRKIEKEINPDVEIIRFLTENTSFQNSPRYSGSMQYVDNEGKNIVFGLLQEKIEHQGEAWNMALDAVGTFYERIIKSPDKHNIPEQFVEKYSLQFEEAPALVQEFIGRPFYEHIVRLGRRTAEMHIALASDHSTQAFMPEQFNTHYQRSLYSSLRNLVRERFNLLQETLPKLDEATQALAQTVLNMEDTILEIFSDIYKIKIEAIKTRVHGDFHLGQVLFTGKDFVITDFEGETGFSFSERRLKKSPFKDVAAMIRSIQYCAFGKLMLDVNYKEHDIAFLSPWTEQWQHYVSRFYLGAYMDRIGMGTRLSDENILLIKIFLLERSVYELGYELNTRHDWVSIPLKGIVYNINRIKRQKELKLMREKLTVAK
jgi:maltose alpha-D-glucosyltransferase/alpha-amylase